MITLGLSMFGTVVVLSGVILIVLNRRSKEIDRYEKTLLDKRVQIAEINEHYKHMYALYQKTLEERDALQELLDKEKKTDDLA